jgi:hypothetical protein
MTFPSPVSWAGGSSRTKLVGDSGTFVPEWANPPDLLRRQGLGLHLHRRCSEELRGDALPRCVGPKTGAPIVAGRSTSAARQGAVLPGEQPVGRCPTVTEVTASPTRGPAGVVPAFSAADARCRPKPAALTCCPVALHAVSTAEAVVRLASPCRASSTPRTPCDPPSERASWGGRSHPTRRGRWAGLNEEVSGESCRTPLMDDSKIALPLTSAARVYSQCSIVPDRTGSLPKQACVGSVQPSRRTAVGGHRHDVSGHLRPELAKARVLFRPCRFSRLRRFAPRAQCRSVAPCSQP